MCTVSSADMFLYTYKYNAKPLESSMCAVSSALHVSTYIYPYKYSATPIESCMRAVSSALFAVCWSVLQCVAVRCSVLQCVANTVSRRSRAPCVLILLPYMFPYIYIHTNIVPRRLRAVCALFHLPRMFDLQTFWKRLMQHTTHCNALQHTATHCNAPQHTTTHCITLQHTATKTSWKRLVKETYERDL